MDGQTLRNLQEAYMEVVENQQLDELSIDTLRRARKERFNRVDELETSGLLDLTGDDEDTRGRKKLRRTQRAIARKTAPGKPDDPHKGASARLNMEMEYDAFDAILEHLLDEGYADTNEAALVIMANMSEEWRQSIVEGNQRNPEKDERTPKSDEAIPGQAARKMPPRGHADREAFEKWYAKNVR